MQFDGRCVGDEPKGRSGFRHVRIDLPTWIDHDSKEYGRNEHPDAVFYESTNKSIVRGAQRTKGTKNKLCLRGS